MTSVDWRGHRIQLIDTPGHVDFAAEVERVRSRGYAIAEREHPDVIVTMCGRRYGPRAANLQKQAIRVAPRCLTCWAVYAKRLENG